ncbi:MAG: DNA recombination protein RmuC [Fibrobacter sp.]|nr:DNA recombination protein RmuC [Fibrobacter sp.]
MYQNLLVFIIGIIVSASVCFFIAKIIIRNRLKLHLAENANEFNILKDRYSAKEIENSKLQEVNKNLQINLTAANSETASLKTKSEFYEKQSINLTNELQSVNQKFDAVTNMNSQLKSVLAEMKTQLASEQKHSQEKLDLLKDAKTQLTMEFKSLANGIFEEKTNKFSEQSKTNLDLILNPFREQIHEFRKKVEDVYINEAKERHALAEHIKNLADLNKMVSKETINLTNALKGENKTQGNWGELILERALELSGLKNGVEYETQTSYKDNDGNKFIPDVVVHLPDNKDIIVDSKVTLVDYERAVNADVDNEREIALSAHVAAVKNHINQLSTKAYDSLSGIKTLDFVLMFMPIEAAFIAAIRKEPELFEYAFRRRIIIVSPSTLLVTLKTVQNIWQNEYQNRNTQEIVKKAADLYDKFVGFTDTLFDVKKCIASASDNCEKAIKQLTEGKGNITGRIESFRKMGVAPKKQIPSQLLELTDDDAEADNIVAPAKT